MTAALTWVRYGRPAALALREAVVAAKDGDALAPVTVVVPSNAVGVGARRQLAGGSLGPLVPQRSGLAAVTFLTVYRLAELLAAPVLAGSGRRPVSTPAVAAALRRALAADPGVFASVAQHPATEAALLEAYRELRDCSAEALASLAATSRRAADVVRLAATAQTQLEADFFDEEDLLDAACAAVDSGGAVLGAFGPVVVYLPERVSRHGARLLSAVAARGDLEVIAGACGDRDADAEVVTALGRLFGDAGVAPPPTGDPLDGVVSPVRTALATMSDADEEVRSAVRAVVAAVRAGTPLDRIALLYGTPVPYARLVSEQLRGAGIAYNGASVVGPGVRVAGRTLLRLLELHRRGLRREDVFTWLSGAWLSHDGRRAPVGAWERISREAGVVAGRGDWDLRLARYIEERRAELGAVEADPDAAPWRAEHLTGSIERAEGLRSFVVGLSDELDAAAATPRSWSARAAWARSLSRRLLGDEASREHWPLAEQRAATRVERALDRLGCLDEIEPAVGLDVFTRTLAIELDQDPGREGRMGEGVLVGPIAMGVGAELDLVVVLGLVEGSFPGPVRDDSLLPDHEREAAGGELARRDQAVERQHRHLLATLAGAARQLLCVPRGDLRRSVERVPSRWALDVGSRLNGARLWSEDLLAARAGWIDHSASYDAALRRAEPATAREHRLRALLAAGGGPGAVRAVGDGVLEAGAEVVHSRRSDRFTRFDGNLGASLVPSPVDSSVSATSLEAWVTCPFAYLVRYVLGVEPVELPEDRLTISPGDRGLLVHEILERFVKEAVDAGRPDFGAPWEPADRARLRAIAEEVCARYEHRGLVGRAVFWGVDRRRILVALDRLLDTDDALRRARRSRPVAAELAFGVRGATLGPVELALPDGRSVAFRGRADRVDESEDGDLQVIDYKTGRADRFNGVSEDSPDGGGRHLQLPVYGLAARAGVGRPDATVSASYWFISGRERAAPVGYPVTPAVLARVGATVWRIVSGIESGVFPSAPHSDDAARWVECPYCDPDGLGTADLVRQLARKRGDPAFRLLLDPTDEADPTDGEGEHGG